MDFVSGEFSCPVQILTLTHRVHTRQAAEISTERSAIPGTHTNTNSTHTDITTTGSKSFSFCPAHQGRSSPVGTPSLPHPTIFSSAGTRTAAGPSNPRAVCPDRVCPETLPSPWAPFVQPPALIPALSDLTGPGCSSVASHPSTPHHRAERKVHCKGLFGCEPLLLSHLLSRFPDFLLLLLLQ